MLFCLFKTIQRVGRYIVKRTIYTFTLNRTVSKVNMSTLCKLDFPLYCCDTLDESHIVVAGGGGASKTGVPNTVVRTQKLL